MGKDTLSLRDERGSAADSDVRKERDTKEDALLDEEAQRARARQTIAEVENNFLPEVPKIPGHHLVWASTTSTKHNPQFYRRRGYTPVMLSEIPADEKADYLERASQNKSEYAGMVMCNEMLAMKIPEFMYQEFMKHYHHDLPMQFDARMVEEQKKIAQVTRGNTSTGEGFEQGLGTVNKGKGPPVFE